jgi:protein-S-isoprenylcysteine O-methyltransferase Ste14
MTALKTLLFTVLVPGTVAGLIPWMLLQGAGQPALVFPSFDLLALVPLLFGIGLYLWCAGAFTFIGKGTPAPIDAPTVLVIQGPYRLVRNPMYVAVLAVLVGEAWLFHSWLLIGYALVFWSVVHTFVVFVEEPGLQEQFGAEYERYRRAVPRWLPRLVSRG